MAKLKPGPFGHPTGRIGNTVFYTLNGQAVCRSIGDQKNNPTLKQEANREVMKMIMGVLKPMQGFIKHGFEHQAKGTVCNPFNLATSYNINNALTGIHPNISIDYNKVKLSSGALHIAKDLQISKTEGGLTIKWNPVHEWKGDQYDDLVMIALFHPKEKKASLFLNAGKRDQGECFIPIDDQGVLDEQIEAYVCFKSADGRTISDSVYLGNVNGITETVEKKEQKQKYNTLKIRLKKIEPIYLELKAVYEAGGKPNKTYRHVKKEYDGLKKKLDRLPGRPAYPDKL